MRLHRLLPEENFVINSKLSPGDVRKKLEDNVEPIRYNRNPFSRDHRYFQGEIAGDKFKITKIVNYKNSFTPVIEGEIKDGSIDVTMRLNKLVSIFVYSWLGSVLLFLIIVLTFMLFQSSEVRPTYLFLVMPFAMLIFASLFVVGGFRFETNRQKEHLKKIFDESIEER